MNTKTWPPELIQRCPRCGNEHYAPNTPGLWFSTTNAGCNRCHHVEPRSTWNTRPIEDRLGKEIKQLTLDRDTNAKACLEARQSYHYANDERLRLSREVDRLRADLARLATIKDSPRSDYEAQSPTGNRCFLCYRPATTYRCGNDLPGRWLCELHAAACPATGTQELRQVFTPFPEDHPFRSATHPQDDQKPIPTPSTRYPVRFSCPSCNRTFVLHTTKPFSTPQPDRRPAFCHECLSKARYINQTP